MAGAGYKLFNTGDVLTAAQVNTYLMEQTVMVFADAAARTAALSGVVSEGMISYLKDTNAVEVYNGSAWVASDDPNAIQNTIVDAKGDLITATGNDVPARIAVGNNGENLVADSSTSTGLRYNPIPAAGKNLLINGNMAIAQRGTSSVFLSEGQYRLDRWGTCSYQTANHQQVTTGSTTVPSYFALRSGSATTAQASGGSRCDVAQQVETALAQNFAGRTVTLSFWVRFSAATIANSGNWLGQITTSTSSDPAMGTTVFTALTETTISSGSYPTTWTKYSVTGTIPTNARSIRVRFYFNNLFNTTNANDAYFDITGVQLELGSVATEFTLSAGTLAGELAACQRYYVKFTGGGASGNSMNYQGSAVTTTITDFTIPLPVEMRVEPTALDSTNLAVYRYANGFTYSTGTFTLNSPRNKCITIRYTHGSAVFTVNDASVIISASTAATNFGLTAEL